MLSEAVLVLDESAQPALQSLPGRWELPNQHNAKQSTLQILPGRQDLPAKARTMSAVNRRLALQILESREVMTSVTFIGETLTPVSRHTDALLADLDGDQDLDLVLSSFAEQTLSWHANDGHGTFSAAKMIDPTAGPALTPIISDLDRDGDNDLIVGVDKELHWYENLNGQGGFALPRTVHVASGRIWQVVRVNLDGDADDDLVTMNNLGSTNQQLTVLKNTGNAALVASQSVTIPPSVGAISVSDLDHDGDQDVLLPDATFGENEVIVSRPTWLENTDAQGKLSELKLLSAPRPGYLPFLMVTDLDGDTRQDFFAQRQSGQLEWSELDQGENPFASVHPLPISTTTSPVLATTDLNEDGISDLLFAASDGLKWLPSRTNTEVPYDEVKIIDRDWTTEGKLLVGDLDGDQRDDFIAIDGRSIQSYRYVPLEDRFESQVVVPQRHSISDVQVVDVDSDGWNDIVTYASPDILGISIQIHRNEGGTGSFASAVELSNVPLESLNDFQFADLNGDGRKDLIMSFGLQLVWQRQASDAVSFSPPQSILTDQPVLNLESVDLDRDSDIDLVVLKNNGLIWLENTDGKGNFQSHTIATLPSSSSSFLAVGDLDGDSNLDLVVPSDSMGIQWFQHRDGKGNFRARGVVGDLQGKTDFRQVELHDMNGDGRLDLTGRSDGGTTFGWLENSATGFKPLRTIDLTLGLQDQDMAIADFDGDQDLDVMFAVPESAGPFSANYHLTLYENQGNGQLQPPSSEHLSVGGLASSRLHLAAGNLNGDQRSDLVFGLIDGELSVLTARTLGDINGDDAFDSADLLAAFQAGEYEDPFAGNSTFFEGDWNGDGEFDTQDLIRAWQIGHYRGE